MLKLREAAQRIKPLATPATPSPETPATPSPETPATATHNPLPTTHNPTSSKTSEAAPLVRNAYACEDATPPSTVDSFDAFWSMYPKKVGKEAARKSWRRIHPNSQTLDVILTAIRMQAASSQWRKNSGQFIPNPTTWLNQGRWEDEGVTLDTTPPNTSGAMSAKNLEAARLLGFGLAGVVDA